MSRNPADEHRLHLRWKARRKRYVDATRQQAEKQAELAKERTQYFEKIALGSGATIAAVVSFIGSQKSTLQPAWLFRSALIALVVTMVAAMYRNYKYPYYVMNVFQGFKLSKWQRQAKAKREILSKQYRRTLCKMGSQSTVWRGLRTSTNG